ncbi:MAG: DNA-binding protein [Ruminococcaceae bacterium]|nr:DNA-binding protein [Oscillospiraceae bacterium]
MSTMFVTITGIHHYYGDKPFEIGRVVRLVKEPDNKYDDDAIRVELPFIETVGYVANSTNTVYRGTYSAGRIYDKIEDAAFAEVAFITHSSVIAAVLPPEAVEEKETEQLDLQTPNGDEDKPQGKKKFKIGF